MFCLDTFVYAVRIICRLTELLYLVKAGYFLAKFTKVKEKLMGGIFGIRQMFYEKNLSHSYFKCLEILKCCIIISSLSIAQPVS